MILAFLLVLLFQSSPSSATTLTYRLDPNGEDCFYDDVERAGLRFFLHFAVLEAQALHMNAEPALNVDLVLYDPSDAIVFETYATTERRVLFTTSQAGTYRACFSNRMSTQTTKVIALTVHVGDPLDPAHGARAISVVERSLMRVHEGLSAIKAEQEYLRVRERAHRDTAEDTNSRILWWGLLEIGVVVGMAALQVIHIRKVVGKQRRNV